MLRFIIAPLCLAIGIVGIWFFNQKPNSPQEETKAVSLPVPVYSDEIISMPEELLPGDEALMGHGSPKLPPLEDLKILHSLIGGYLTLNRHIDPYEYSTNAGLTALLIGKNKAADTCLSNSHPIIGSNIDKEPALQDRWKNPYIIHLQEAGHIEFRSSGPDGIPYTPDDLLWPM